MRLEKLPLYFHTVRYLKPVQIFGRLWFRLAIPRPARIAAPARRPAAGAWTPAVTKPATMTAPDEFRLLNQSHRLTGAGDWNNPVWDKLWLYNLHYFDDLNADRATDRAEWHRRLMPRWIADNPPGGGNGWEPYPLSLRIVNWIKWALGGHALEPPWLDSLATQAGYLRRRIEYHLLGNHLFANAKALIFAGSFFAGPEADRWRRRGLAILQRELPEQVLADGGHSERSPMYHAIILEDLLDLINLAGVFPETVTARQLGSWRDAAARMGDWLMAMSHPDGEMALFNDAALDIAAAPARLADYAARLGLARPRLAADGLTPLPASGYVRLQQGGAVVLLDVAEIGPAYLPGHAHADTLAFEWSLFGQRVLVNSGTSCYGAGPERQWQRSTPAHNTVTVAGENSSEVWGGFRVARRAHPFDLEWEAQGSRLRVRCAHDGYRRLPGRPVHWREWRLAEGTLVVKDQLSDRFQDAVARYYFHPAVTVTQAADGRSGLARLPDGHRLRWRIDGGTGALHPATWHPRFGVSEPNRVLAVRFTAAECEIGWTWW